MTRDEGERFKRYQDNDHIREQVKRIMPAYRLLVGANEAQTTQQVVDEVARLIVALEMFPDCIQVVGVISVDRDMHGYRLRLNGPTIHPIRSQDSSLTKNFVPRKIGSAVVADEIQRKQD